VGSEHLIVSKPQLGTKINKYLECAIIFAEVEFDACAVGSEKQKKQTEVADFHQ